MSDTYYLGNMTVGMKSEFGLTLKKNIAGTLISRHVGGVAMEQDNTIYIDRSLVCAGFNSNITGNIRYGKTDTLLSCMYKGMGGYS